MKSIKYTSYPCDLNSSAVFSDNSPLISTVNPDSPVIAIKHNIGSIKLNDLPEPDDPIIKL